MATKTLQAGFLQKLYDALPHEPRMAVAQLAQHLMRAAVGPSLGEAQRVAAPFKLRVTQLGASVLRVSPESGATGEFTIPSLYAGQPFPEGDGA